MTFKRKLYIVLFSGVFLAIALSIISKYYVIAFAQQECLPYKIFFIEKGKIPKKGEFVYFKGSNVPNFNEKTRFVKLLAGLPGENIVVKREKELKTKILFIKGVEKNYVIKTYVEIPYQNKTLTAFERGSSGKLLPQLPEGTHTLTGYFVIGTHEGSYDSRYFGGIPERDILGKAHPIF